MFCMVSPHLKPQINNQNQKLVPITALGWVWNQPTVHSDLVWGASSFVWWHVLRVACLVWCWPHDANVFLFQDLFVINRLSVTVKVSRLGLDLKVVRIWCVVGKVDAGSTYKVWHLVLTEEEDFRTTWKVSLLLCRHKLCLMCIMLSCKIVVVNKRFSYKVS